MNNNLNENGFDGFNVGLSNVNVLDGTDIGLLRKKGSYDKSTYTRTTHPDGTVTEKIKLNQKSSKGGVLDLETKGVNFGDKGLNVGLSSNVSEDIVSFVDSIWGSKTAASKTQDVRMEKAKLEKFRAEREQQQRIDSQNRQNNYSNQQSTNMMR